MNGTRVGGGANVGFDPGAAWHVIPQHHVCSRSGRIKCL
jgi:hypothetical protein